MTFWVLLQFLMIVYEVFSSKSKKAVKTAREFVDLSEIFVLRRSIKETEEGNKKLKRCLPIYVLVNRKLKFCENPLLVKMSH